MISIKCATCQFIFLKTCFPLAAEVNSASMKSPRLNISFPDELQADLAAEAARLKISAAALARLCVVEKMSEITGKNYGALAWGGLRHNAGKKNCCKKSQAHATLDPLPKIRPENSQRIAS